MKQRGGGNALPTHTHTHTDTQVHPHTSEEVMTARSWCRMWAGRGAQVPGAISDTRARRAFRPSLDTVGRDECASASARHTWHTPHATHTSHTEACARS